MKMRLVMRNHKHMIAMRVGICCIFALVLGLTISIFATIVFDIGKARIRDAIRSRLHDMVGHAALLVNGDAHNTLIRAAQESSTAYLTIKATLRNVRDHTTDVRYVYTMRLTSTGQPEFVVDAEEDPAVMSHIGDLYKAPTPLLLEALQGLRSVYVEQDFAADQWGRWLSGYAPFFDSSGKAAGIVGIDISAKIIQEYEHQYFLTVAMLTLLMTAGGVLVSIVIARRISRPLMALASDMSRIQHFELGENPLAPSLFQEIHHMQNAVASMKRGLRSFKKFVPADLVAQLLRLGIEARLGGERRDLTIFFSDIIDFSGFAESAAPETLVAQLGHYLTEMTRVIHSHEGTVDKYMGDGVMAFWNAPARVSEHPLRACEAALQWVACEGIDDQAVDRVRFRTRIGIHCGEAVVGNMGNEERMNYTAIGDAVNLASRLESMNKIYGTSIIISEAVRRQISGVMACRLLDYVVVKGRSKPIYIYELCGRLDTLTEQECAFIDRCNEAAACYCDREWDKATLILSSLRKQRPWDRPVSILLDRLRQYVSHPPPLDWDGAVHVDHK